MAVSSSLFVHVFVHFVIHNAPPLSPRISRNASFTPPRMSILDPTLVAISVLAAGVPTGVWLQNVSVVDFARSLADSWAELIV
ncbi:hypothetical protein D9757_013085 [Collybiopsis confluens]|uniref:Uncharacterized protein n=1 Tax=Collybiopsis confluens TaxID=2823264 RepID=A0A8H5LPU6_9AGAR|nr:hypothetical protein D9757_013085 [Collybiopsis confluens]